MNFIRFLIEFRSPQKIHFIDLSSKFVCVCVVENVFFLSPNNN